MVLAHNITENQRTRDIQIAVDVTFGSMLLSNNILEGLKNSGFYKPSPIQLHGIPLGKCGFDLILEAKSGTGKTAVFAVIALEQLDLDKGLQSVILAPTREIATQIRDVIQLIGSSYNGLNVEVVIGGLSVEEDITKFQNNVHILVGSPGRMRYLIQDKHVDVSAVRLLVLDEADKLIDKSFQPDINYIFSALPKQKQVILSSATYPDKSIIPNYVKKAQHICPDSTSILLGIKQFVTIVKSNVNVVRQTKTKFDELLKILSKDEFKQCLIFCNYQVRVGELCKMLRREKWSAEQLHGQLQQTDRLDALKTLQEYKCRILVSTDLAARGIDASNVDLVINFEPPFDWQTYLHRIGRAGRFGSYGIAITVLSEGKENSTFKEILKSIGSSINMHYLWNDDRFQIDESDTNKDDLEKQIKILELETSKRNENCETTKVEEICDISTVEQIYETTKMQEIRNKPPEVPEEVLGEELVDELKCKPQNLETSTAPLEKEENLEDVCKTQEQEIYKESLIKDTCRSGNIENGNKSLSVQEDEITDEELLDLTKCHQYSEDENPSTNNILDLFEKSNCKIESFDELIASFKEYGPKVNEQIEIQDIKFTNNLNSMLNDEIESNNVLDSNSDTDLEEGKNEKDECIVDSLISNNQNENKENSNTCFVKQIKPNSLIQLNENQLQDQVEYTTIADTSSQKAFQDAGLPTAFGSTKFCNRNIVSQCKPLKYYENVTNKQKSNNIKHKASNITNDSQPTKNKIKETKSSTDASVSFDDDGYNTHSGLLSRSTKYISSQNHKHRHIFPNNNIQNSYSEIDLGNVDFSSETYRKYMAWYKRLKTHIQHVEMSIYIEELSQV